MLEVAPQSKALQGLHGGHMQAMNYQIEMACILWMRVLDSSHSMN